jgi:hypothetical protein
MDAAAEEAGEVVMSSQSVLRGNKDKECRS